jgi:hypothetical protein
MTTDSNTQERALRTALRAARENEDRWTAMSQKFSDDSERMKYWASIDKLRQLEVERIERLLAGMAEPSSSPQSENL